RTGLPFQRLGSRPNRPNDLGDGSPRHHSRLLPNRRRQSATKHAAAETRLDDGCSWWFKKISDVERLESPSARLARRLVLNDPSSLSVRHLRSATAERPFRKSGTDGSNPVPSSGESTKPAPERDQEFESAFLQRRVNANPITLTISKPPRADLAA